MTDEQQKMTEEEQKLLELFDGDAITGICNKISRQLIELTTKNKSSIVELDFIRLELICLNLLAYFFQSRMDFVKIGFDTIERAHHIEQLIKTVGFAISAQNAP